MNFEKIIDEAEKDFSITKENIDEKKYSIVKLHSKYSKYLYQYRKEYLKVENKRQELYRKKFYFYKEEYSYSLTSTEIKFHIESDNEYMKIKRNSDYLKSCTDQLKEFVEFCNKLGYFIKNIIDHEKFINGEH